MRDLLHLKQFLLDGAVHLDVLLAQVLLDDRRALVRDERDVGASVAALLADAAAREVRQVAAVDLALCGDRRARIEQQNQQYEKFAINNEFL